MKQLVKTISLAMFISLLNFSCDKPDDIPDVDKPPGVPLYEKASDILWASPRGFDLTMDIYTPIKTRQTYPVIIIFHGGGWLINNKGIMTAMSEYLVQTSEYVVCNVNYRLLGDLNNTVTMNEIIEDAFGAVLWIKENISKYKGDPTKIIVTGDSAGGHLAAAVTTQINYVNEEGFSGKTLGFRPSYIPQGKTIEQIKKENGLSVQAAMLSYGVFDLYAGALNGLETKSNIFWGFANKTPRGFFGNTINAINNPEYYLLVSPFHSIPKASTQKLPPLFISVGSNDNLVSPASIEAYINKLKEAGHTEIEYWIHEGRPHAFLDGGSNASLGISFDKDATPALNKMVAFLNKIFY